jgi:hypothetical protein
MPDRILIDVLDFFKAPRGGGKQARTKKFETLG